MGFGEGTGQASGSGSGMGEWQHGLFGCFDNCTVCIITYFCPCYTFGKNAEVLGESCILYALSLFVPILNIYCLTMVRGRVRSQKGIDGTCLKDLLCHLCCSVCALVQEAQELGSLGGGMAIDGMDMDRA